MASSAKTRLSQPFIAKLDAFLKLAMEDHKDDRFRLDFFEKGIADLRALVHVDIRHKDASHDAAATADENMAITRILTPCACKMKEMYGLLSAFPPDGADAATRAKTVVDSNPTIQLFIEWLVFFYKLVTRDGLDIKLGL